MMIKSLEELQVFQKSLRAADEISALTRRPCVCNDFKLRDELRSSSGGVPAQIAEGFGHETDRQFAHYCYIARATTKEVRAHLSIAKGRGYVNQEEWLSLCDSYDEIARMLTGLIRHLETEDRKHRG
jgi:four helix bundle protein